PRVIHPDIYVAALMVGEALLERFLADGEIELAFAAAHGILDELPDEQEPWRALRMPNLERGLVPDQGTVVVEAVVERERLARQLDGRKVQPAGSLEVVREPQIERALPRILEQAVSADRMPTPDVLIEKARQRLLDFAQRLE